MKRTLVIGDIHGGLLALKQVLKRAHVTPEDHLIFLGDYVDGWSDSVGVIDYLTVLSAAQEVTLIRGNHDDLVHQWLTGKEMSPKWIQHGGQSTKDAYAILSRAEKEAHLPFYERLKDYYIDDQIVCSVMPDFRILTDLVMNGIVLLFIGIVRCGRWSVRCEKI